MELEKYWVLLKVHINGGDIVLEDEEGYYINPDSEYRISEFLHPIETPKYSFLTKIDLYNHDAIPIETGIGKVPGKYKDLKKHTLKFTEVV